MAVQTPLPARITVRVHRDLQRKLWICVIPVSKKRFTARRLTLADVSFTVRPSGRRRSLATRQRNVHAYAVGVLLTHHLARPDDARAITYRPLVADKFELKDTGELIDGARLLYFDVDGAFAVDPHLASMVADVQRDPQSGQPVPGSASA